MPASLQEGGVREHREGGDNAMGRIMRYGSMGASLALLLILLILIRIGATQPCWDESGKFWLTHWDSHCEHTRR